MKAIVTVFLLLLVFFLAAPVYASNVTIKVESVFLQPLENCFVMLDGVEGITDSNGTVFFEDVVAGNYSVRVVREGQIQESSVLVEDSDVTKTFSYLTQGDWQIISFLGLAAVAVIAAIFLFSRIKLDKREPYGSQLRRGKRWDRG